MQIFNDISQINQLIAGPKGIIIGNFDGVHLGHKHLIDQFLKRCQELRIVPILLTLDPHPLVFFKGEECASLLSLREEKLELIKNAGIENIFEISFTSSIQSMDAKTFIKNYLLGLDSLKLVYLGHDFSLGNGKEEAKDILYAEAPSDLLIDQVDAFEVLSETCSSTAIRDYLRCGNVLKAATLLGRPYGIEGVVKSGDGNGTKFLVPTANLEFNLTRVYPPAGVYYTSVIYQGIIYSSVTNIGFKPTFGDNLRPTLESHLINFNGDLYEANIKILFHDKCRDEKKFKDVSELKEEILKNIEQRRKFKC